MDIKLTPEERFEVFGDFDPEEYADEAAERWGDTDAYQESARRSRKYTKEDWEAIKAEGDAAFKGLAEVMTAGVPAEDARAQEAVDKHRLQIDRWFYACSRQMYAGILEMQVGDQRFRATWDGYAEGLLDYALAAARAALAGESDR